MERPRVLLVRETSSLGDSVQLLLETVGFRVVSDSRIPLALSRLASDRDDPIRAIVIACNRPTSDLLQGFPESFPAAARDLPLLVVGDRVAGTRRAWPSNVRFVRLPTDASRLLELLDGMTSVPAASPESAGPATS